MGLDPTTSHTLGVIHYHRATEAAQPYLYNIHVLVYAPFVGELMRRGGENERSREEIRAAVEKAQQWQQQMQVSSQIAHNCLPVKHVIIVQVAVCKLWAH